VKERKTLQEGDAVKFFGNPSGPLLEPWPGYHIVVRQIGDRVQLASSRECWIDRRQVYKVKRTVKVKKQMREFLIQQCTPCIANEKSGVVILHNGFDAKYPGCPDCKIIKVREVCK